MIIGLTGPKLAGKGTAAQYLHTQYHASVYSLSTILVDIAKRLHISPTREHLIKIATGLRSQFGEDVLAQVLEKDIEVAQPRIAVIDAIRMPSEYALFSKQKDFLLLYIDSPVEERYKRAKDRAEKPEESTQTFDEFQREEQAITEKHIQSLHEHADAFIQNSHSVQQLYSVLDEILKKNI